MVVKLQTSINLDITYPERDGQPMADNTKQFEWIVVIKENLELLFADNPDVFVAGDLLWYPVEGNNTIRRAPDVMVAFGRPKGHRGSYLQWIEENISPQVVFEILSPGNTLKEMAQKLRFYDRYGVEEYYLYDPDKNDLTGWLRSESGLEVIDDIAGWVSPALGVRFELTEDELQIYRPDGQRFTTYVELAKRAEQAEATLKQTEATLEQTEATLKQTEATLKQTEATLEQERQRSQALEERLRALGVVP